MEGFDPHVLPVCCIALYCSVYFWVYGEWEDWRAFKDHLESK